MRHNIGKRLALVFALRSAVWGRGPASKESANEGANLQIYGELAERLRPLRSRRDASLRRCYPQVRENVDGKTAGCLPQVGSQLPVLIELTMASLLVAVKQVRHPKAQ